MKTKLLFISFVLSVLFMLGGCAEKAPDIAEETSKPEESIVKEKPSLSELLESSGFENYFNGQCEGLKKEFTMYYEKDTDENPILIGYCHHNDEVGMEQELTMIAAAEYNEKQMDWEMQSIVDDMSIHLEEVIGEINVGNGSKGIVLKRIPSNATFGATGLVMIYKKDGQFTFEMVNSNIVVDPEITIEDHVIILDDKQVKEAFAFVDGKFISKESAQSISTVADYSLAIDMNENGELLGSVPFGSHIPVQPGDIIAITRAQPIDLANFQIRTSMESVDFEKGLYRVQKKDIGERLEIGNYPFDEMLEYTIGTPKPTRFSEELFTKSFYNSLASNIMPGSPIGFSTKQDELFEKLGEPDDEYGWKGANYLQYGEYTYSVAFPFADDFDGIYTISRTIPFEDGIMGSDIIKAWGEPDLKTSEGDPEVDGIQSLVYYEINTMIHVRGPEADSLVWGIELANGESVD